VNPAEQVIRQKFQEYYLDPKRELAPPPKASDREYGFLLFTGKFMVRHRSFKDTASLLGAVRDLVPSHVYFSTAYYQEPTAPMEEKGWTGADLVFDIDADHLDTPCKPNHDSWKCKACGTTGKGGAPKLCPKCKNDRMEEQTWLCDRCLQQAKEETAKLLEMLYTDLGIDHEDTRLFFSGHRGYHVHVYSKKTARLGEEERREIADYLLAQGLDPQLHELEEISVGGTKVAEGPLMGQPGWRGRIVAGIYDILGSEIEINQVGLTSTQVSALRSLDRENLLQKPFWSSVKGVGLSTWKTLVSRAVEKRSAKIDSVVTTDIHRLIRMPGTLNGHTGLLAMNVPEERLDEFDPFTQPLAFQGEMKVKVKESPSYRLGEEEFGPYRDETVVLPSAAAMLLLCKHRADPAA
jgi:DNA primase small subunit